MLGNTLAPFLPNSLTPPPASRYLPALRAQSGGLVTGRHLPALVARHFSAVSQAPPSDPSSQAAVLQTLRDSGIKLSPAAALPLGAAEVTVAALKDALHRSPPGRSPGPDGIPLELYRSFGNVLLPVLAAVFTAIGRTGATPANFLDGALITLYKKGDPFNVANYRPITLLNTDYRLLAKVLANRLGPSLNTIITAEQTAFLPGRHIGDNIMFLQLLPALLRDEHRHAVIAFLDFAKAFDTIDRSFLFSCLDILGLGDGFLHWARILLTDTFARAIINGFPSARAAFLAGVRQGCPLAPLLYLCLAQALQCWLLHNGIGLPIDGRVCTGTKFADDTTALLPSADPVFVQKLIDVMAVFGRASGQHLNLDKCELLPVGAPPPLPLPPQSQAFQCVPLRPPWV